jgi:hypothetical protein
MAIKEFNIINDASRRSDRTLSLDMAGFVAGDTQAGFALDRASDVSHIVDAAEGIARGHQEYQRYQSEREMQAAYLVHKHQIQEWTPEAKTLLEKELKEGKIGQFADEAKGGATFAGVMTGVLVSLGAIITTFALNKNLTPTTAKAAGAFASVVTSAALGGFLGHKIMGSKIDKERDEEVAKDISFARRIIEERQQAASLEPQR